MKWRFLLLIPCLMVLKIQFGTVLTDRASFFHEIMGISEQEFVRCYSDAKLYTTIQDLVNIDESAGTPIFYLKNKKTNEMYKAGFFTEYSLYELQEQCSSKQKKGNGKFNVIESTHTKISPFRDKVDIGALQADPCNNDAVFQIASNFSALEPTGIYHFPEQGVTGYIHDYTQGPFAAISAAPGLIYRMYYIFYNKNKLACDWRQTKDHQINLLDKTLIPNENGYVVFNDAFLKKHPNSFSSTVSRYSAIKIGYHQDIEVTYGFAQSTQKHVKLSKNNQTIHQVFTAAVDFGTTNSAKKSDPVAQKWAQALLDAAYEGTIRAAIAHDKKKVFLTLIGGGVFDNDLISICTSLEKTMELISDYGLDVTLVIYDSCDAKMELSLKQLRSILKGFVAMTQGIYTIYHGDTGTIERTK